LVIPTVSRIVMLKLVAAVPGATVTETSPILRLLGPVRPVRLVLPKMTVTPPLVTVTPPAVGVAVPPPALVTEMVVW